MFAHEVAKECMLGNDCERILCMFKHNNHITDDEESDDEESDDDENAEVNEGDESSDGGALYIKDVEPRLKKVEESE